MQATSIRQLAAIVGSIDGPLAAELLGIAESLVPEVRVSARDAAADARLRIDLVEALGAGAFTELVELGLRRDAVTMYATVGRALARMSSD